MHFQKDDPKIRHHRSGLLYPPLLLISLLTEKNALKIREHAIRHTHLDGQHNVGNLELARASQRLCSRELRQGYARVERQRGST